MHIRGTDLFIADLKPFVLIIILHHAKLEERWMNNQDQFM
jgi:hypothetical protein